jgi:beta-lactamase class D OXA-2
MNLPRNGLAIFVLLSFVSSGNASEAATERADWKKHFDDAGAKGTIIVIDERASKKGAFVYNAARAKVRYSPASTYKIPHTLFALQEGAVRDEFQVFQWDGVRRTFSGHNQDQDLRSAMRYSTLWVYQRFAKHIGESQARKYLNSVDYGNADPTAPTGDYWVDGNLRISAVEQIAFLQRLYRNQLPFSVEHQRLVKDLVINEAGHEWILRAKTGWEGRYGWWVGWVEWREGPVFFALNIDTPNRTEDLGKRQTIAKAVLRSMQALPADPGHGAAR